MYIVYYIMFNAVLQRGHGPPYVLQKAAGWKPPLRLFFLLCCFFNGLLLALAFDYAFYLHLQAE